MHVDDCLSKHIEGVDYVQCRLCMFAAFSLKKHLTLMHGLTNAVYVEQTGGSTLASKSKERLDWVSRLSPDERTEYLQRVGQAVTDAIMADLDERKRRSEVAKCSIGAWARSDEGRRRSSDVAKVTSVRPDVVAARSAQLAAWREREPERFYDECVAKMIRVRSSHAEKNAAVWLIETFPELGFKWNQQLRGDCFMTNVTRRRQIDVMSKSAHIIVEIDGLCHFKAMFVGRDLVTVRSKDDELNAGAVALGFTVIRVSYDQFDKRNHLTDSAKARITAAIAVGGPVLHLIGDAYEQR